MKLRTSYFNGTVLKKDITRFAPVWGLYMVFLLLLFTTIVGINGAVVAELITDMLPGMVIVNLLYGGICANLLFGDLFNPRMCNALHAMPMRREGWFLTHLTAGMLFCIVPNLLGTLILSALLRQYFYMAFIWLAIMVLQFLFFFGVGIFSVMCAGNRLAMAAIYGIINLFSLLVYVLMDQFYVPLLYGVQSESTFYEFFCPLAYLTGEDYVGFRYDQFYNGTFEGFNIDVWHYLFGIAGIGIVLLVLSVLIYRRRKLETAGDFIALRPLAPVFQVIYTLGVGVAMYALTQLFGLASEYIFIAIGIIVGFFTGKMLLERTVRVFRLKNILGFAAFAIVLAGSFLLTRWDPMGISRYLPETEDIAFMRVYRDNDSYTYGNVDIPCYELDAPEEIEEFRQVHKQLMNERGTKYGYICQVEVLYQLKDGSTVKRYYQMDDSSAAWETLKDYFSTPEYLFNTEEPDTFAESIYQIEMGWFTTEYSDITSNIVMTDPAFFRDLTEAITLDCNAGCMSQDHVFHPDEEYSALILITLETPVHENIDFSGGYRDIYVYPCCTNTLAFIDEFLETYKEAE